MGGGAATAAGRDRWSGPALAFSPAFDETRLKTKADGCDVSQDNEKALSLDAYASRLFRIAGGVNLGGARDFYFKAMDEAKAAVEAKGQRFVSFANYDYLGLSRHPAVEQAAIAAIHTFGPGCLASRVAGGERSIHRKLEADLAAYVGKPAVMALVSGFLANETLISNLFAGRDLIFYDEYAHASILAGLKGTRARSIAFPHNDLDRLEALLSEHRGEYANCAIAVEGLYSMDGDIPDLNRLVDIKDRHGAWLMIDEAHSYGVLGKTGRGICEHAGVDPSRVELLIGTLSKTFVSCGGFIAASQIVIDILRLGLTGFTFSVGIPPVIAAIAQKATELATNEGWRVDRLAANGKRFMERAQAAGLDTGLAIGLGVIPIMFRSQDETVAASQRLMAEGIYAPPIVMAGAPKSLPRIRFFLSAGHEEADIDRAIDIVARG